MKSASWHWFCRAHKQLEWLGLQRQIGSPNVSEIELHGTTHSRSAALCKLSAESIYDTALCAIQNLVSIYEATGMRLGRTIPLQAERHSGRRQKVFAFPPEPCSASDRNAVRDHNGMVFGFTPESRSPSSGFPTCQNEGPNANLLAGNPNRVVTISSSGDNVSNPSFPCEVDYPVTFLRTRTDKNHTIKWVAADHDLWVVFDKTTGSPVGAKSFKIIKGQEAGPFPMTSTSPTGYFLYAIYDSDPNSTPPPTPCLAATADRDTGVIVKR